jgi:UDP-2,4-diacetamido-2,4,6-trideoxy-beta-L-altropyranose hydrolase
VFRLEAGGSVGWGHLARCAALAAEMKTRGWACTVWTSSDLAAAPDDLREPFAEIRAVGGDWLRSVPAGAGDWIVVDSYDAGDADVLALRSAAPAVRVLVIDDEAVRNLDAAHLALNPRLGLEHSPYATATRALLGEKYALLRPALHHPSRVSAMLSPKLVPVLVMMGGTDPRAWTADVVDALADVDAPRFAPVVVSARKVAGSEAVARALARFPESFWVEGLDAAALAGWAGICRYAVTACGGALYEFALLGLPFVGVVVAPNQRAFATEIARRWQMPVVDAEENVRPLVADALRRLFAAHAPGGPWPRPPIGGIDGRGAARVADVIEAI